MRKSMCSALAALVFFTYSTTARSDDLLTAVEQDVSLPVNLEEFLKSPQVIRYRFVIVDSETLWDTFEAVRDLDSVQDGPTLDFDLFEGLSFEMRIVEVHHRYWSSSATLVNNAPDYGKDTDANIFATVRLERDASASIDIYAAGEHYSVMPIDGRENHVVVQLDPDEMPSLD
ncbi:MAG: hypothetical protein QNJ11_11245 [Woeseiaceae bacterium]|nr:hypothetical protein [Woeseiaceae bacterium]